MKIKHKLFVAILGVTGVVLLANFALARWSFDQGFKEFVGNLEQQRLNDLGLTLKQAYKNAGDSWINADVSLINRGVKRSDVDNTARGAPSRPAFQGGGHPPLFKDPRGGRASKGRPFHPPPHHQRGGPPPYHPNEAELMQAEGGLSAYGPGGPPTALFDHRGQWLAGVLPSEYEGKNSSKILLFDGDTLIGELRGWPKTDSPTSLAAEFSKQQLFGSLVIGVMSLLLAGLIAWWIAKRLTQPIDRVSVAVSGLTGGDYQLSFDEQRVDELGELMENLEYLANTLDKSRSAKRRFFADVSHELRTPLTVLSGEIEVLKAGIREFDDKQLDSFEHEVGRLRHLVEDLHQLSVSDMGGLRYTFEKTNITDCMSTALDRMRLRAQSKGLDFEVKGEPGVFAYADSKRIGQLFLNLCQNSIIYTDAPGKIRFEVSCNKNSVRITVNDTQPSVPEAECSQLLEPLYRQDESRTRSEAGSGLGLAICKNIVEAHNGSISVMPSALGGLRVMIRLEKWTE